MLLTAFEIPPGLSQASEYLWAESGDALGSPSNSIWAAPLLSALFIGLSVGIRKCLETMVGQVLVCSVISSLKPSSSFLTGQQINLCFSLPIEEEEQKAAHWFSRHTVMCHMRTPPGGLKSRETREQSFQFLRPLWWEKPHYHACTVASISRGLTGLLSFLLNTQRYPTYMRSWRSTNHDRKAVCTLPSAKEHLKPLCFYLFCPLTCALVY